MRADSYNPLYLPDLSTLPIRSDALTDLHPSLVWFAGVIERGRGTTVGDEIYGSEGSDSGWHGGEEQISRLEYVGVVEV